MSFTPRGTGHSYLECCVVVPRWRGVQSICHAHACKEREREEKDPRGIRRARSPIKSAQRTTVRSCSSFYLFYFFECTPPLIFFFCDKWRILSGGCGVHTNTHLPRWNEASSPEYEYMRRARASHCITANWIQRNGTFIYRDDIETRIANIQIM